MYYWLYVCLCICLRGCLYTCVPFWDEQPYAWIHSVGQQMPMSCLIAPLGSDKWKHYSKMEIHMFQCSWFLNHHSWVNLMIMYGCDILNRHWFKRNIHIHGSLLFRFSTRGEIAECNVGWFHYHRWLVMSSSNTKQSWLRSGNQGRLALHWLRLSNTNSLLDYDGRNLIELNSKWHTG